MATEDLFNNHRLILYYKGDISALTLFAQHNDGQHICFPKPLPLLSSTLEQEEFVNSKVSLHPSTLLTAINQLYHFENDLLQIEAGFSEQVDTSNGLITVYMARFMLLDPPHALLQSRDCKFKTLPELRGRQPAEMELLRRAYVKVMES
ncbi:MAG: hypothetical protein K9L60_10055 [Methylovulum sp.]|jgi:hypothetical protein|nr:hypothetical protein [Methylovulum sp.]MCF7999447.1 hypothetical protein [Methylovulum sp.]